MTLASIACTAAALVAFGGGAWLTMAGAVSTVVGLGPDASIGLRASIAALALGLILFVAGAIPLARLAA